MVRAGHRKKSVRNTSTLVVIDSGGGSWSFGTKGNDVGANTSALAVAG